MNANSVQQAVEQIIENSDLFIVQVAVSASGRIVVELDKDHGITIDECVEISRRLHEALSPEIDDYQLEVSSPGLTAPLRVYRQYLKHIGDEVEVVTTSGVRYKGTLQQVETGQITLKTLRKVKAEGQKKASLEVQEPVIPFSDIKSTKLIVNF